MLGLMGLAGAALQTMLMFAFGVVFGTTLSIFTIAKGPFLDTIWAQCEACVMFGCFGVGVAGVGMILAFGFFAGIFNCFLLFAIIFGLGRFVISYTETLNPYPVH